MAEGGVRRGEIAPGGRCSSMLISNAMRARRATSVPLIERCVRIAAAWPPRFQKLPHGQHRSSQE